MTRRAMLWPFTVATLALATACGSDGSGPALESYSVRSSSTTETNMLQDGTRRTAVDLIVEDGTTPVEGARLKYAVDAGTLSTSTGTSNAAGFASVAWTVTPEQWGFQSEATFSACAENQDRPTCTPVAVLWIAPGGAWGPVAAGGSRSVRGAAPLSGGAAGGSAGHSSHPGHQRRLERRMAI
jgi:hypothetical protein